MREVQESRPQSGYQMYSEGISSNTTTTSAMNQDRGTQVFKFQWRHKEVSDNQKKKRKPP